MASFNWPAAGGGGGGVSSLETLVGDITIVGGTNISVSDNGTNEITISTTTTDYIASVSDTTTINLTVTGDVLSSDVNADSLTNVEINSAAGIVYSKLSLTDSIINADINSAAGIVYSKLDLTGSIVNADVDAAAAIVYSKLNLAGSIQDSDINTALTYSVLDLSDSIVNADINSAAAIAYSKLDLTGSIQDSDINTALTYSVLDLSDSIVNADINSAAAIVYSKLALTDSIVNADINSAAAIAYSKLDLTGSVNLTSDVTGILPLANGGTGSATQNFVDLTTDQSIAGDKKFLNELLLNENTAGAFVSGTFDTATSVVSVFTSGSGTLEGLSGKVDQVAILVNNSSSDITVENDSASASAGNKIITGYGSDIQWKDGATLFFVNANETWNLVGGSGGEGVAARYETNSGQSIPNATFTTVVYEDLRFDTHSAYNTSTGVYTASESGIYNVYAICRFVSTPTGAGFRIFKNNSTVEFQTVTGSSTVNEVAAVAGLIKLDAGDNIRVQVSQSTGSSLSLNTTASNNQFTISKVN